MDTVTVASKYPGGLQLRLHEMVETSEQVMGGGSRKVRVAQPASDVVLINGTAAPFGQARRDADGAFVQMAGGYALTFNVPKDFWDKWLAQNRELDLVRNNMIFAHEKPHEAEAWAKDHASIKTGLEPLTPTVADGSGKIVQTDPRAPSNVQLSDERKRAA